MIATGSDLVYNYCDLLAIYFRNLIRVQSKALNHKR